MHIWNLHNLRNTWKWSASVCDPYLFPMKLRHCRFDIPHDFYVFKEPRDHRGIQANWGENNRESIESRRLPKKLELSWYSLREDRYYSGEFKLPIRKIKKEFKKGYVGWRGEKKYEQYFSIGIAPGGLVVLWISPVYGEGKIEIGRYNAKEIFSPFKEDFEKRLFKELKQEEKDLVLMAIERKDPILYEQWRVRKK